MYENSKYSTWYNQQNAEIWFFIKTEHLVDNSCNFSLLQFIKQFHSWHHLEFLWDFLWPSPKLSVTLNVHPPTRIWNKYMNFRVGIIVPDTFINFQASFHWVHFCFMQYFLDELNYNLDRLMSHYVMFRSFSLYFSTQGSPIKPTHYETNHFILIVDICPFFLQFHRSLFFCSFLIIK